MHHHCYYIAYIVEKGVIIPNLQNALEEVLFDYETYKIRQYYIQKSPCSKEHGLWFKLAATYSPTFTQYHRR